MKHKLIFILFLIAFVTYDYGQDTTYFDYNWNKVKSINSAWFYEIIELDKVDSNKVSEKIYFKSGQIRSEKFYSDYKKYKLEGKLKEYYENGQLRKDIDFKNGEFNGKLLTYWYDGKPKRIDSFENGKLIDGKCFNSDGKETIHYDYEIMPEFQGGINNLMQYIAKETKYPKKSRKKGIEGKVVVGFTISTDGSVSDIKIVQSVNEELDSEALRVVRNIPKWNPGMQDGEAMRVAYNLPINFRLE